ncbi:hypothetical protein NMY22_g8534 [Coprinellus aureogranulatus]|nr:hypothetical protein NMY22_g8534 [Coprinellus aureogranulatus]
MVSRRDEFPTELWDEIFRLATDVPDPLTCFAQDYHGFRRDPAREPYQRYKASLATKLAICGVSRQWHAMGTPLLYERIVIPDPAGNHHERRKQLHALLRTFVEDAPELRSTAITAQHQPNSRLCGLVRRLDIAYPGEPPTASDWDELGTTSRVLVELVGRLHNLEVLDVFTGSNVSPLDTLEALSPQLTHLHWSTDSYDTGFKVPVNQFLSFLDSHPRIETVDMSYTFTDTAQGHVLTPWRGKALHRVHHWDIRQNHAVILQSLPSNIFPNLKTVTYPLLPHFDNGLSRLCEFLAIHGRNLTTIRLTPQSKLQEVLEAVTRVCPHLQEVQLVYARPLVHPSIEDLTKMAEIVSMPRVVTLCLTLFTYYFEHDDEWYKAITLPWKHVFPGLRKIKLLDEIDVLALKAEPEPLQEVLNHCATYGVELEDHFGESLTA